MPSHHLPERSRHEGRQQGTEVDAHVEDGEAGIAPRVVCGVELPDHHADAGLEEPGADHDQGEARDEGDERPGARLQRDRFARADAEPLRQGEGRVPGGDDPATDQHGAVRAEESVRQPAAENGRQIYGPGVEAVQDERRLLRPTEARNRVRLSVLPHVRRGGDQVEHEQRAHSVVAEALPHLGDEENAEPLGLRLPHGHRGRLGQGARSRIF